MMSFQSVLAGRAVLRAILLEELARGPARAPELVAAVADLEGFSVGEIVDALSMLAALGDAVVRMVHELDARGRHASRVPVWSRP
jgi:hypothetical protein